MVSLHVSLHTTLSPHIDRIVRGECVSYRRFFLQFSKSIHLAVADAFLSFLAHLLSITTTVEADSSEMEEHYSTSITVSGNKNNNNNNDNNINNNNNIKSIILSQQHQQQQQH